jgi:mRNA-degrading endonuclease RelE of RelBE toxin-antitoxin system
VTQAPWDLVVAGPARPAIDRLSEKVALAVLDYLVGPLLENPKGVGKPLRGDLAGLHPAKVGAYRIVYQIDEPSKTLRVIYIDHRADIYRPRIVALPAIGRRRKALGAVARFPDATPALSFKGFGDKPVVISPNVEPISDRDDVTVAGRLGWYRCDIQPERVKAPP